MGLLSNYSHSFNKTRSHTISFFSERLFSERTITKCWKILYSIAFSRYKGDCGSRMGHGGFNLVGRGASIHRSLA
jgi:hypothetical protein